ALDLSPDALSIARQNAANLGADNIRFIHSDWFAALPSSECFELIVSNPPYIAGGDPHLTQGDVRFEPLLALASGPDGLDAIRRIVREAPGRLNPGGWLLFEHGFDQAEAARELLDKAGFEEVASFADLQGHGRVSGGHKP
ncbi:partial Release factor glutamine methyltransferase, partial [uncultured bacterium]